MVNDYIKEINDCIIELEKIQNFIAKDPLNSMVGYLNRYAIVRSCGIIENVCKKIICKYCTDNSNKKLYKYFNDIIVEKNSMNPSIHNITSLLEKINHDFKRLFKNEISKNSKYFKIIGDERKYLIDLLVEDRNRFSHGIMVNTTLNDTLLRFQCGKEIINILYKMFHSDNV